MRFRAWNLLGWAEIVIVLGVCSALVVAVIKLWP